MAKPTQAITKIRSITPQLISPSFSRTDAPLSDLVYGEMLIASLLQPLPHRRGSGRGDRIGGTLR